jgi:hypothetical protein
MIDQIREYERGGGCRTRGKIRNAYTILVNKPKENLEDLDVNWTKILKLILKK